MSVSPAQNFSKPPPVPEVPTVIFTSGFSAWNCLGRRLGERADGARAVDGDRAGEVAAAAAAAAAVVVVVVAAGGDAEGQHAAGGEREELPHAVFSLFVSLTAATLSWGSAAVCYPLSPPL